MISLRIRAALAAVALAFLTVPTPAQAEPVVSDSLLNLTVVDTGTGTPLGRADLLCHPAAGTHPEARAACAALDTADGELDRLAGTPGVLCYQLYAPVTATAVGSWAGRPVRWEKTFGNICELHTKTGPAFRI
ncbi:SSI family serine proteinase inhibitor [Kitasatospora azatica]|uniref:SSI family serine proteinase inhibitor n=1 Tax=Kitasatospora azatica TaxID=58347 RepID=UPI001E53175F|nr:SSI family serine proteinase inhibitor [Kitasatospora azatica]